MDPRLELLRTASFPVANMGYQSTAVHQLLSGLSERIRVGEPIMDLLSTELPEVSFGYDRQAVDALLRRLDTAAPDTSPHRGDAPLQAVPEPGHDDEQMTPRSHGPAGPVERLRHLVDEVDRVRFRMTRRRDPGYRVDDVDNVLDGLIAKLNQGTLTADQVHGIRFNVTGTLESGYDMSDVDDFLDRLADAITHGTVGPLQQVRRARARKGWLSKLFGT